LASIDWCKAQKKGLSLIEPNDNLAKAYILEAEETLQVLKEIKDKSRTWLAVTKYYCEYFSIYALLMKIGIKSEIHDCTIEVCGILEKEKIIPQGYKRILEKDKQLREDNQYYLKNREVHLVYDALLDFVLILKDKINTLTREEIERVRKIIGSY